MATPEPRDLVRVLIPDTDAVFGEHENEYLFEDEALDKFLIVAGGSVTRAAGLAMIAVGNSEALISKVIKTQDLMTDGSKLQREWRESGETLLLRADREDLAENLAYFELVDFQEGWETASPELTEWGYPWG